jgi:hypothetical protein
MSSTIRFNDGDIEVGSTGEQIWITDIEKAAQDTLDELLLPYNPLRDRGCELFRPDGSLAPIIANNPAASAATVKLYIQSAVNRLMRAQRNDSKTSREELIQKISSLVVRPLDNDPRSVAFVLVLLVNDKKISLARAISMRHQESPIFQVVGGANQNS